MKLLRAAHCCGRKTNAMVVYFTSCNNNQKVISTSPLLLTRVTSHTKNTLYCPQAVHLRLLNDHVCAWYVSMYHGRPRWLLQVDTEMDFPLAMERPLTEATTPTAITISFFAPRPTLPKMKIIRFVVQVIPKQTKHESQKLKRTIIERSNRGTERTDGT